jgi:uncharacterized circularly permuted ATP-grasp superfamily protein
VSRPYDEAYARAAPRGRSTPSDTVALDPVPRILTEPEWSELQAGLG